MPIQPWKILKHADRAPEIFRCIAETPQWASVTAAYLTLSRLQYPKTLRLRTGEQVRMEEHSDIKTFWQVFLRQVYSVRSDDRVILDVGANIGLFTLYAARSAPRARIVAIEPFPSTYARLLNLASDHRLETRVTCLNYAAVGAAGFRTMRNQPTPSQRRSLAPSTTTHSGVQVEGKTLEQILDENELLHVDLMKMDIEGSEYEVLLSMPLKRLAAVDRIAVEYHGDSAPHSKQDIFDYLAQAGFRVTWDEQDQFGYGVAEMIRNNRPEARN